MRKRVSKTVVAAVVTAAVLVAGATAAAIATLTSKSLTITSQSLAHATCTLSGTAQSTDAYTDEKNTTTNNSTSTTLSLASKSGQRNYAWIQFSLSACSFPANAVVDSALLTVNLTTALSGRTLSVSPGSATWTASSITWSNQPATGAATTTFTATAGSHQVDVSQDVDGWVDGSSTNGGWQIADLGTSSATAGAIGASENTTTANRPSLQINYAY